MKKKLIAGLSTMVFVAGALVGAGASGVIKEIKAQLRPDFKIEIDGKTQKFKNVNGEEVQPILYEGTTYLPIRAIGEIMGKKVYWYEKDKRVVLTDEADSTVTDADVIVSDTKANKKSDKKDSDDKKATVDTSNFVGEAKAEEIALAKAGLQKTDVVFDKTELDNDNGVWHYEVEFRHGINEYDAKIKADDGTILKWEVDIDD